MRSSPPSSRDPWRGLEPSEPETESPEPEPEPPAPDSLESSSPLRPECPLPDPDPALGREPALEPDGLGALDPLPVPLCADCSFALVRAVGVERTVATGWA